ncbi:hypothetical protein MCP1_40002 [Candidatus Terasakiella magnetica]|nr:hypothetical protein MCP1_40002 [Candidatus Terasakiella magnetica]
MSRAFAFVGPEKLPQNPVALILCVLGGGEAAGIEPSLILSC